jgi:hypothetical protein
MIKKQNTMSWFVAFSFIWAMCIAVGAIFAFVGICNLILAKASLAWPTTQGKVQSSSVVTLHDSEGGYNLDHAVVIYEFNVNNNAFIGKRIAFGYTNGDTISNPRRAQEIVDRYPQDKNVTVYYMPNNPKECLLEVGVKGSMFVSPGFGLFFFTVGILSAVFLPRA